MYCTFALFCDRSNVQQYLQVADFQSVEKQSAPRSKFVKVVLRVSVAMVSVPYSFGRSAG